MIFSSACVKPKCINMNNIPYESKIMELLSEMHESWMDENDKEEFDEEILKRVGGIQKLSDEIRVGVCNGYTVNYQMEICRKVIVESST